MTKKCEIERKMLNCWVPVKIMTEIKMIAAYRNTTITNMVVRALESIINREIKIHGRND